MKRPNKALTALATCTLASTMPSAWAEPAPETAKAQKPIQNAALNLSSKSTPLNEALSCIIPVTTTESQAPAKSGNVLHTAQTEIETTYAQLERQMDVLGRNAPSQGEKEQIARQFAEARAQLEAARAEIARLREARPRLAHPMPVYPPPAAYPATPVYPPPAADPAMPMLPGRPDMRMFLGRPDMLMPPQPGQPNAPFMMHANPFGAPSLGEIGQRRVSLRADKIDAMKAIQDLLKEANADYVIGGELEKGRTVTFRFSDVPLEEALASVAEATGLGYHLRGNVIVFTPRTTPLFHNPGMFRNLPPPQPGAGPGFPGGNLRVRPAQPPGLAGPRRRESRNAPRIERLERELLEAQRDRERAERDTERAREVGRERERDAAAERDRERDGDEAREGDRQPERDTERERESERDRDAERESERDRDNAAEERS